MKKIIKLDLPENESLEDYEEAMDIITEESLRCMYEEENE